MGRPMTGRMSPSMMKVESVKSNMSMKQLSSGSKYTTSGQKMVLKSNVAMASELPKSIPKTMAKKGSAERKKK